LFIFFSIVVSFFGSLFRSSSVLRHNALGLKGGAARVPMFQTGHGLPTKRPIPGVAHVVAVASGKGGVGKSTCAGV
jgi:ATP-binding protein involved in chromosome partitioning